MRIPPVLLLGGLVALVLVLLPIAYAGVRATDQGWAAVGETVLRRRTLDLARNSILLAATVTVACTVIAVAAAWLVTSTDLPGRRFLRVALAMPLALPSYVAAWAWIGWRHELAGFWGAALVLTSISYPYVYLPVLGALRHVDPALVEVARASGRGPLHVFFVVTLRQVRIAAVGGALLVMLYVLSEFGAVSIMRYETLTRVIYQSYRSSFDRTPAAVLGCVLIVIALVPLALSVRYTGRERAARVGGGTARRPVIVSLGRWRWPAAAALVGLLMVALGVPAANLVHWVRRGTSRTTWSEVIDAATTTLWVSALAAAVTVAIAIPVAILSARHAGRFSHTVTTAAYGGHALPGIVVALSLVFFGVRYLPSIYQRTPMLLVAYAVIFLSLAIGAIHHSVAHTPLSLGEAARAAGRTRWGAWRAVDLPLAAPGIGAAATLVFIATAKELPATLLLRPIGMETLATRLWSKTDAASYAAAAPYAAVLVLVAAVPTALLTRADLTRRS